MALATDWNFNVTGQITPIAGASVCFSNLTVATTLANTYGASMASGDVSERASLKNSPNGEIGLAGAT
jgi:hypothetical protein